MNKQELKNYVINSIVHNDFDPNELLRLINLLPDKPQLNENQQIVLDWLKWDFSKNKVKAMECIYRIVYGENILDMVLLAYIALDNDHQVQVLEVFSKWAQEMEDE